MLNIEEGLAMIHNLLIGGAIAAISVTAMPVFAQAAPPPPPGVAQGTMSPPPMPTPHSPPIIRRDVEIRQMGDRVMNREDVIKHVREMFERLDTNHDGFVTKDEVAAFDQKMMRGMQVGERFKQTRFEEHGPRGDLPPPDRAALFDKLDANHDGVISRQEFMAARPEVHERRVEIIRRDGPGGDAPMPPMEGMRGPGGPDAPGTQMRKVRFEMHGEAGFGAHLFAMADTNHDGRVSLAEAEAAALAHFDKADLNHDGRITPDERQQVRTIRMERRPS